MKRSLYLISIGLMIIGCRELHPLTDVLTNPTPRERYARNFESDTSLYSKWERAFRSSFSDSLEMLLPHMERGRFNGDPGLVYGYQLPLQEGQRFQVVVETDVAQAGLFLDLYLKKENGLYGDKAVASNRDGDKTLQYLVEESGSYKLILQPEIGNRSGFLMRVFTTPVYEFPVSGYENKAIMSYWGDPRDAGGRKHEGIDIFAPRGTPVVAAVGGNIRFTGERGLGGKQVWLREGIFGKSIYYAHLDRIAVGAGSRVKTGDTLGFVGNSGNARTTTPHLHFGIYDGDRGAQDPLPFVLKTALPKDPGPALEEPPGSILVSSVRANLRKAPALHGEVIGEAYRNDTLRVLGSTPSWMHILAKDSVRAYIHRSLVSRPGS